VASPNGRRGLFPASDLAYGAVDEHTKAEIDNRPQVNSEGMVLGSRREAGQQEEVDKIAQDNRQQRLQQVYEHQ